jgi:hypothetical protein
MVTPKDKKLAVTKPIQEVELYPDAWERFRQAVHVMTKAGPQHREPKPTKERSASKGRVHKGKTRV